MHQTIIFLCRFKNDVSILKALTSSIGNKVNEFELTQYFLNSFNHGTLFLSNTNTAENRFWKTGVYLSAGWSEANIEAPVISDQIGRSLRLGTKT